MSKFFSLLLLGSMSSILFSSVAFAQAAHPISDAPKETLRERAANPTPDQISKSIPNIQGKWTFSISGENRSTTCTLIQKGNVLTGKFRGEMGDLPISGTVAKDRRMEFMARFGGMRMKFSGTVDGQMMKGIVDLPMGRGRKNWTATK
jgi:hypothetical protein